ncbi:hypothetical protein Tco_0760838 [Tanacetum coccineum]
MTRQRLHTDSDVCMYALIVSTIKPKNIKEAMADHSWIKSMQDELNSRKKQFEDIKFELVSRPEGKNYADMQDVMMIEKHIRRITISSGKTLMLCTSYLRIALNCLTMDTKLQSDSDVQ